MQSRKQFQRLGDVLQHVDEDDCVSFSGPLGFRLLQIVPHTRFMEGAYAEADCAIEPGALVESDQLPIAQCVHLFEEGSISATHVDYRCILAHILSQQARRLRQVGLRGWHFVAVIEVLQVSPLAR